MAAGPGATPERPGRWSQGSSPEARKRDPRAQDLSLRPEGLESSSAAAPRTPRRGDCRAWGRPRLHRRPETFSRGAAAGPAPRGGTHSLCAPGAPGTQAETGRAPEAAAGREAGSDGPGGLLGVMAALGRRVLGVPLLTPVTWALTARKTHLGERKRTTSVLQKQTLASGGRVFEELPCVGLKTSTKEPECRTGQVPGLLEERTPLEPEVISSLLDMGFSEAQARGLLRVQPGTSPRQLLGIISQFILLGLNPEPVCVALKKSPQLLRLPVTQMKKRCSYLRRLGLEEGKLKRVIYCCPEVFSMRQQDIDAIVRVLKEKCLFTVQQVTEIVHRCPYVLREDPGELEYKFQYAYFRMGIQHPDLVKTELLQYSLTKIKQRHIYLERLGRYQTPDKKGQTQVSNPPVKHILRVSEAEFLARTACSSAEEFEVFKQLLAREEEEELEGGISDDETAGVGRDDEEDKEQP